MNPFDFVNNINIDFNSIIPYLTSVEFRGALFHLRNVFAILSGLLLGMMIFFTVRTHYLEWLFIQDLVQFVTMRPPGTKKITRQWNKILDHLKEGTEPAYKLTLIEADDMLDTSLKRMGYQGQTLEEKLGKLTSVTLPNIEQVYEIHRLRNNIVHDPDYRLTLDETKKALDIYSQAFRDLHILGE